MSKLTLQNWLERSWYGRWPFWALLWLQPLYVLVGLFRRAAYRAGLFASWRAPLPVLVVGNLTVGGTGKTPLTITLIQQAQTMGLRVGVVSRGYGRQSQAPLQVTAQSTAEEVGDEPLLIYQRTNAPVAVATSRAEAARLLLANNPLDLLITDDGLQHYALARDAECVVVDGSRGFGNGWQLPSGPLREPLSRLKQVDAVMVNQRGGGVVLPEALPKNISVGEMALQGNEAVNILSGETKPLVEFSATRVAALAGIGNPQAFYAALEKHGMDVAQLDFPDHHSYRLEDLPSDAETIIMTEKDAVKVAAFASEACWYVPVNAQLTPGFGEQLIKQALTNFDQLS